MPPSQFVLPIPFPDSIGPKAIITRSDPVIRIDFVDSSSDIACERMKLVKREISNSGRELWAVDIYTHCQVSIKNTILG